MDFDIITNSLKKGWEVWKNNAVAYVVGLILMIVVAIIIGAIVALLGGASLVTAIETGSTAGLGLAAAGMLVALIVSILVLMPLGFGVTFMAIKGFRGEKVEIKDIFYSFRKENYVRMLIFGVVYAVIFGILGIIPIIGGLIALIVEFLLFFAIYIYIMTPSENIVYAFKESFNIIKDNLILVLVAYIVYIVLVMIGAILFGIGLLVTLPIALIFATAVLKSLKPELSDASGQ
ncbi:hypothetical protein [Methanimicrococcus blatticola]|uniref:Uncharacterized protein n=1 Tax=Methanimicrococcus blatticola TaxID=91560 RepID=A0A484F5C7_9EURY|nr:hypothetical protein [Methanimicrococcus blatticola]MBZ3935737.1 hypothetical protein [Methanimicrococcus blatticola]MCC2508143.1 hypothetical protein [Methanimicrococcus blatticola]TDQ68779.1 hypothetical protein C7391_0975 [Methanimicrococcus blatticola]